MHDVELPSLPTGDTMLTKKRSLRAESLEHRAMLAVVTDWGTFADNADAWPSGWEDMEIEAKWSASQRRGT